MELFSRFRDTVFLKEDSDLEKQLNELRNIRDKLQNTDEIDKDIKLLEYGIAGEKEIAFELKNANIGMYVLHDVTFEYDGNKAQIDYLLITRGYCYLIECKNLYGNITVDNNGQFYREYEYKGKKITVMGSGMGMPSMGIYSFELFHFFDVDKIIRIGTCGVVSEEVKVPEIILASNVYSESTFAYAYDGYTKNVVEGSKKLNKTISDTAKELDLKIHEGTMMSTDVFGPYVDIDAILDRVPNYLKLLGEEMEGFALLHVANSFNKEAAVMATAVDSKFSDVVLSIEDREKSLNDMITLALESIIK